MAIIACSQALEAMTMLDPLWRPGEARLREANLTAFTAAVNDRFNLSLDGYSALHAWSIAEPEAFWSIKMEYAEDDPASPGGKAITCDAWPTA